VISAQELAVNQSSGGEKTVLCTGFFCIFIIMIIIIIIINSIINGISFAVLLNCLYLNPQVLLLVHFSSPPHYM